MQVALLSRQLPSVLTVKMAAVELSQSVRKIQILMAKGILSAVTIDGRKMVPRSEIERLSTPKAAALRSRVALQPKPPPQSLTDEINAARDSAKRRRLR
jgi:hypothetical protein